jgi:hypothetical protein
MNGRNTTYFSRTPAHAPRELLRIEPGGQIILPASFLDARQLGELALAIWASHQPPSADEMPATPTSQRAPRRTTDYPVPSTPAPAAVIPADVRPSPGIPLPPRVRALSWDVITPGSNARALTRPGQPGRVQLEAYFVTPAVLLALAGLIPLLIVALSVAPSPEKEAA